MIILLDTSIPICKLALLDDGARYDAEWQADRTLAHGLIGFLQAQLQRHGKSFTDVSGIGVFQGPGSFTGLRIGLTVMNTLADSEKVAIIGGRGENWQQLVTERLLAGEDEKIVLPFYGGEAHITTPRK
jgi:tRNA threonylcarbamoyladenosine biosynthesis protein TsaB